MPSRHSAFSADISTSVGLFAGSLRFRDFLLSGFPADGQIGDANK